MERNGDLRRATVSGFSSLQRKQQETAAFRESSEEEGQMELQEMLRLRDREQFKTKDRDRELPKRRRVDRPQRTGGGGGESYRENESTESSDDEYYEEEEEASKIYQQNRMNQPPPSLLRSNNRRSLRTLRSSPVIRAAVDEMIGFEIPRRARSKTSIKRVHEHWNSASGGFEEDLIRRKFSTSPVTESPIGPERKKMKSVEPGTRTLNRASNSRSVAVIQDDIEFEVAEALFDLMKQSQSSKNIDRDDTDIVHDAEGGREENSALLVQIEQSIKVDAEAVTVDSVKELNKENSEREKFSGGQVQESVCGDDFLNEGKLVSQKENESSSRVKINACKFQDLTLTKADCGRVSVETKKETELEIDLMTPLTLSSSLEKDVVVQKHETISKDVSSAVSIQLQEEKIGTTSSSQLPYLDVGSKQQQWGLKEQKTITPNSILPFPISMNGWPGVLPHPGYMTPQHAVLPMDGNARSSIAVQTPQFIFAQPLLKKCATHQYIALNIQNHLQLIKKPLLSEPSSTASFYTMTQFNLNSKSTELKLSSENHNGSGNDKSFEVAKALNTSTTNKLVVPQQAPDQTPAQNFLQGSALIFPLGHHQTTVMAPSNTSPQLQNMSMNEAAASYMAKLQKNGNPYRIPPNITLEKNGSQVPIVPFFNSSFYSSPAFNVSQNQQHLSLPHAPVQSTFQNTSNLSKPPMSQKQTSTKINDNKSIPDINRKSVIPCSGQIFSVPIQQMNALVTKNDSNPSINPTLNFLMLPDVPPQKNFHASEVKSAVGSASLQNGLMGIFRKSEVTIPNFQQQQQQQHQHHQQLIQLQKHHMQQIQLNGSSQGQKHIPFGNMPVSFQGQHNY